MNGPEHYAEAERLLLGARRHIAADPAGGHGAFDYYPDGHGDVAAAQVHAVLALAAKTVAVAPGGTFRPNTMMERVSAFVAEHDGCTARDISDGVNGRQLYIRSALSLLIDEGFVTRSIGVRRTWHHHTARLFRVSEEQVTR